MHVAAVAEGLAALGHEVHGARHAGRRRSRGRRGVRWIAMPPPLGSPHLRWPRAGAIARLARGIRPDAIIERYYNFGGEGDSSPRRDSARSAVLEVNAPVVDSPRLAEGAGSIARCSSSRCGAGASGCARAPT